MDSAWIAYNKPKSPELANEYAGFLMALGLNGHLTKLATLNIHDYLTKVHTSTGMLKLTCAGTIAVFIPTLHFEFHTDLTYNPINVHWYTHFGFNDYFCTLRLGLL